MMIKYFLIIMLISLYSLCLGQIQFDYQFSIPRIINGARLTDLWLTDYDENGIDEICTTYYDYDDLDNWCLVEYNQEGDSTSVLWRPSLESQQFRRCFTFKSENTVYRIEFYDLYIDEILYCLMDIYDNETNTLIDTEQREIGWSLYSYYGYYISTSYLRMSSIDDEDYLYHGLIVGYGFDAESSSNSIMLKYSFEDGSINLIEEVDRCGYKLFEPEGYDFLIAFGTRSGFSFPDYLWYGYSIKTVSPDDPVIVEDVLSISAYECFLLKYLTENDNNYQDYGLITWETLNYFMTCYSPALSDTTWQICDVDLIGSLIKASTCVSTNQGDHFILYFYEDMNGQNIFDVRNRITGNLALRGETEIMPNEILKKSNDELLFLVKNDSLFSFYTLSEEIQVDIHQEEITKNSFNLTNYPNPCNPETTISFDLSEPAIVELSIYNTKGQKIKTLINSQFTAGKHTLIWDGCDANQQQCASGIYLLRLQNGKKTQAAKILLMK
ncbi:MAG: T9SS type A sorting domain-containing protein [Candidatus Stygibacter australis]|nr:T9SS type A sorting domain-containing protein [Candidatus Stygibacter australis]MDP8321187.1 T9SS type A sorting domain-containing protein [Candidatus Stygibacter australis]